MSPLSALQPLKRKLPLLISALLGVVVTIVCWSAYRQVQTALTTVAEVRVAAATQRLASMLHESAARLVEQAPRSAREPAVARALVIPDARNLEAARKALAVDTSAQLVAAALLARDGRVLVQAGRGRSATRLPPRVATPAGDSVMGWIGPFEQSGDSLVYTVAFPVLARSDTPRDTLGHVVVTRYLGANQQSQIAGLIGSDATILLGNSDGTLWSDFSGRVDGPPAMAPGRATHYDAGGRELVGAVLLIADSPWRVSVQIPLSTAIAPARDFVARIALVGLVLVGVGAIAAWLISQRVTEPLAEVARAAEEFSSGDYGRRVKLKREDEIGALAAAFDRMAERVSSASLALEDQAVELESQTLELTVANEQLRRSEHLLAEAERIAHVGSWTLDLDGETIDWSDEMYRIFGEQQGRFRPTKMSVLERVHEDDRPQSLQLLENGLTLEAPSAREVRITRRDGQQRVLRSIAERMIDAGGKRVLVGSVQDVTPQREAEVALRESEQRYRGVVEHSPDAILVHRDRRILFANPAAATLFGAPSADAIIGRSIHDFVHPSFREAVEARVLRNQEERTTTPLMEQRIMRLDGRAVFVETIGIPFTLDGKPSVLTILRDVDERKRLEEVFRHSQRMDAVGQLAGGVAHDFNNLLTVITSYSSMLIGDRATPPAVREDVEEILGAAERAAGLTRQLLAFSRRQMLQPRELDLNALTRNLEKMLGRLLREDIQLVTNLHPSLGVVRADPGQIEQAIVNLVVNARDAMPDGGRLTIETANVELDGSYSPLPSDAKPGRYVMLAVSDTGHGMTDAVQERMFEPFFTTKEPGKGTGLGLSTVYGIMQQSGGSIFVYSEPGQGTSFKLYLPRVAASASPPEPARTTVSTGTETILLVEDEERVRRAARRILESSGYTVLEAATGAEAVKVCERHPTPISLVITDMVMPEMGGRELSKRVGTLRPEAKILFMSGYTEDMTLHQQGLTPGASFLDKPFTPTTLTGKVREALGVRREP